MTSAVSNIAIGVPVSPAIDPWGAPVTPTVATPTDPLPDVPRFPMFATRSTAAAPSIDDGDVPAEGGARMHPRAGAGGSTMAAAAESADGADAAVGRGDGGIPAPGANALELGPLKFNLYGGLIAAGGIAGGVLALRHLKSTGMQTAGLGKVLLPAVAAGVVGARLYHVATDWDHYKDNLGDIPKIWEGGMAIYGGLMAGTAVGALLARRAGLPIAPLLDAAAIGLPLAQAVGRWGNYANQELFGRPTDLPWGLQVDPEHRPAEYRDRNSFHPTFLYESLWNAGLAVGTFALSKAWPGRPPGMLFATYLGGYAIGRFAIEGLRTDPAHEVGGLRTNQWTSLGILGAAGTGALLLARRGR